MPEKKKKNKIDEDVKKLVIARLETLSPKRKISIGSSKELGREELIEHVEEEDSIGEKIAKAHMDYLKDLKKGAIYEQEDINY